MAAGDASEKTEKPTPRRLREAREKGQIARTPELSVWASVLATTVLLQTTVTRAASALRELVTDMGPAIAHPDTGSAARFAADAGWKAAAILAPMLIGMMVIGLAVNIAQVGFKPTGKKLKPDFSRLNPFKGIKRMVGMQAWWELGKSLLKTALLAVVALPVVANAMHTLTGNTADGSMGAIAAFTAHTALTLLRNVAAAGLGVAALDYAIQKRRVMRQLRMTRQEVREELKQQEGSPEMRRAIRTRAMSISRNRMIRMVSMADVITVNPTHYAVALKYDTVKGAPEVLAKGAGVLAAAIRAEGEKHGVPIVQDPVLTRALYRSCEIGQLIPVELYEAVAHLLAFVFGLRARGRAQGVHELPRAALL
jgi:flagellar biosynthetic protein FlhB